MWRSKNKEFKSPEWPKEFTEDDIIKADASKILFFLEECRLYFTKTSECTDSLINKGFILIGFSIGLIGFMITWCIDFMQNANEENWFSLIVHRHWIPILFVILVCLFCWLWAFYILAKHVVRPQFIQPAGATPKNTLKKKCLEANLNVTIVGQMINYQERIDKIRNGNSLIRKDIQKCLYLILAIPVIAFIFLIVYLYVQMM
jgi:hypothetical protein